LTGAISKLSTSTWHNRAFPIRRTAYFEIDGDQGHAAVEYTNAAVDDTGKAAAVLPSLEHVLKLEVLSHVYLVAQNDGKQVVYLAV
jgi:hypothetical protein